MMNRLFVITLLLSSISFINCQSVHFCQALQDNNGRIGYSLTVPNGTFHMKFIVIKNMFWELEYKPTDSSRRKRQDYDDPIEERFIKGPVYLKDLWSKQSEWLAGDYQLAFAIRQGRSDEEWKKTALALVNTNTKKYDWSLFDRNFGDLTQGSKKQSSPVFDAFNDFKPQIAYNSYSRQEQNSVIFIEQKSTGTQDKNRYEARIQVYNSTDLTKGLTNETNDPWARAPKKRKIVPEAIEEASKFYRIGGLFGLTFDLNKKPTNGTIILIEYCESSVTSRAADEDACKVNVTYNYCITEESSESPMMAGCHPAKVQTQKLADCSKPDDWKTTSAGAPTVSDSETSSLTPGDQDTTSSNTAEADSDKLGVTDTTTAKPPLRTEKAKGFPWIVIIIVIIIIVVILGALCLFFLKGKGKGEAQKEEAQPLATPSSMGAVGSQDPKKAESSVSNKEKNFSPTNSMSMPSIRSSIK